MAVTDQSCVSLLQLQLLNVLRQEPEHLGIQTAAASMDVNREVGSRLVRSGGYLINLQARLD